MTGIPKGEPDPTRLFTAIGYALSTWEALEAELARIYSIFVGRPREVDAMSEYDISYRTTETRFSAIERASEVYFSKRCDQELEGALVNLVRQVRDIRIERHRIAHGLIIAIPVVDPSDADENGWISVGERLNYWLGAPWYSFQSLKMEGIGMNVEMIDEHRLAFAQIAEDARSLSARLSPQM